MPQSLTTETPTLQQQIEFIRGARHLVSNEKRTVEINSNNHSMLVAIEENLRALRVDEQKKEMEVRNG